VPIDLWWLLVSFRLFLMLFDSVIISFHVHAIPSPLVPTSDDHNAVLHSMFFLLKVYRQVLLYHVAVSKLLFGTSLAECFFIPDSFIHSGYLYSAPSRNLLRGGWVHLLFCSHGRFYWRAISQDLRASYSAMASQSDANTINCKCNADWRCCRFPV